MYQNTYHETDDSDNRPPTPSISDRELRKLKRTYLEILEHKIKVFEHVLSDDPPERDITETLDMYNRVEVGSFLLPTSLAIRGRNADEAEKMVNRALEVAQESKNELLIAKCEYWMGRVDFLRGDIRAAHKHFLDANACAMDPDEGVEYTDLPFYFDITRRGVSDHTRAIRLQAYEQAIAEEVSRGMAAKTYVPITENLPPEENSPVEEKSTREPKTWKGVLENLQHPWIRQRPIARIRKPRRPVPVISNVNETRLTHALGSDNTPDNLILGKVLAEELGFESDGFDDDTATETDESDDDAGSPTHSTGGTVDEYTAESSDRGKKKQTEEASTVFTNFSAPQTIYRIVRPDSAIAQHRGGSFRISITPSLHAETYERPKEPFVFGAPHEPTKQIQFRLGYFKVGLEKRSRPMTIFPKQPGEITMSPEEWESIEKDVSRKIVTYDYLQRERSELDRVAEEM
ncbi:hypothetical protein N7475_009469 [Penicillium sp. IBT 31633x]|nr:hypothetical protein N7475_009469 [Penicillium sp. IBT 31633x]